VARNRNLTITEAAELTGLSRKAIARRVERGSVRSVLHSGRRLIPRSELARVGLLPSEGNDGGAEMLTDVALAESVALSQKDIGEQSLLEVLVRELIDRVQRQAGELAHYRTLTAEAETSRLQREVADLRVRLSVLEGGKTQRLLERGPSAEVPLSLDGATEQAETSPDAELPGDLLWLPPSAASARTRFPPGAILPRLSSRATAMEPPSGRSRVLSLAAELLFIGLVAVLAWLADLGPALGAAAVAGAWVVAATFEVLRWKGR
jgi:excisionase family DNA binding protein